MALKVEDFCPNCPATDMDTCQAEFPGTPDCYFALGAAAGELLKLNLPVNNTIEKLEDVKSAVEVEEAER